MQANLFKDPIDYYRKAILRHYPQDKWACIFELRLATGYMNWSEKYIDVFVINCYPSTGNLKIAYEIKRTRSDFLKELKQPLKRHPALMFSNQFYFLTPVNLVKPEEIPQEAGLMEMDRDGELIRKLKAPLREAYPPIWGLYASVARSLDRLVRKEMECPGPGEDRGDK